MIFKQLFEPLSSTFTYLLACKKTREAVLVDPVYPTRERDLKVLKDLDLKLVYVLETHVHADHVTSARCLRDSTGCQVGYPAASGTGCADFTVEEGTPIKLGGITIEPLYTPGHTDDHFCYRINHRLLTGDCLLINGCGRTDFQNGDAGLLHDSIRNKLYSLEDETLVYPAHDYKGMRVSCIGQEKALNPRISARTTRDEFIKTMSSLDLAYPKFIDYAVPGNKECGVCPPDLPENLEKYCEQMTESPQG